MHESSLLVIVPMSKGMRG